MSREWYFVENGQQRGQVPTEELKGMVRSGRLRGQDLVWHEALAEWTPVSRLPEVEPAAPTAPVSARPAVITAGPAPVAPTADPYAGQSSPYGSAGASMLAYQTPGGMDAPVSPRMLEALRQTKPWARLVSVLVLIFAGLIVVGGLLVVLGGAVTRRRGGGVPTGMAFVALFYVAVACFFGVAAVFLSRYASRIGDLLQTRRSSDLEAALEAQRSFWRYVGVLALVLLCVWLLGAVLAVALTAARG